MSSNRLLPAALAALLVAAFATAQTTTPGSAVDVEVYNPADGGNTFVVPPQGTFVAALFIRPGAESTPCRVACQHGDADLTGGPAHIAAAVVDLQFDPGVLQLVDVTGNTSGAAADGLIQKQHLAEGRIGWALAGDWTPDGDPSGVLADPCHMTTLDTPQWVLRLEFRLLKSSPTTIHIRREGDSPGFPLSFADVCGAAAFKESNGGIDEIVDAQVVPQS
jgi:hypothetical protein